MKWLKELIFLSKDIKWMSKLFRQDPLCWHMACNYHTDTVLNHVHAQKQSQIDHISPFQSPHNGFDWRNIRFGGRSVIANSLSDQLELYFSRLMMSRQFGKTCSREALTRDWLAQLWTEEKKLKSNRLKKRQKVSQNFQKDVGYEKLSFFQSPLKAWFMSSEVAEERIDDSKRPLIEQPPLSQSSAGSLRPATPEEMKVQPLLARANLLISRDIEWANLMLGFEQENRYAIVDACYPQSPAGFIREQSNVIFRQLLRSRRPFIAYITDAMGNELFTVRRPIWFINSTIYAEINGKEIGVVHRRWHLWRRVYDLYLGKKQFAVVENPGFWNWTFTLKDSEGNVLAEIDRDWRGIGFELFTDAGQYVIRFGHADPSSKTGPAQAIQELEVIRPLTLSERAVAVALAVSLDNDYFSRHGGWGIPFIVAGE